jgi:hypothetical protein
MKLSEIADELSKLNESEQEPDEAEKEAEKAELEKFLVKHPEVTDEMMLSAMRVAAEAKKTDPLTAHAREECRRLGIGDFTPDKRNKIKPQAIPEEIPGDDDGWLHRILEKRRAMIAAQRQALALTPAPVYQPPRSFLRPRHHDSALDGGEWHLGGGGYWR